MTASSAWRARFDSRARKWLRDPAAFCDELPSPWLRAVMVRWLGLGTRVADLLDAADREARAEWRRTKVGLVQTDAEGRAYAFLNASGVPPSLWPSRVLIGPAPEVQAIAVASSEGGEVVAAEIGAVRPGLLALGRRPASVRLYRTDDGGGLPVRLGARPAGRSDLVRSRRMGGETLAAALREAWPPVERRSEGPGVSAYRGWIAQNEPDAAGIEEIRRWAEHAQGLPALTVVMPVHDPRPQHLEEAIASVRTQAYSAWTLCITDDGSSSEVVRRILRRADASDPRIRLVVHDEARGVAEATNAALALAEGEAVVFLDHDDVLAPHALAAIGAAFAAHPEAVAVYSDEDSIDGHGRRSEPRFKPDLDRERLLAQNYVNHAFAVRTALLRRLGGLRAGLQGAQDHDLVLRVLDSAAGPILHIPQVLYHWRIFPGGGSLSQRARPEIDAARIRLVADHLARTGVTAELDADARGRVTVRRTLPKPAPEITAIIPTRDHPGLLEACVTGLLEQTDYPSLKVCVVDNGSRGERALGLLERLERTARVSVMRIDAPFNFSSLNNAAAQAASARLLAFVNDDILVVEPDWLKAMAALAVQPDVGAVGAKLFYPDGRIQHAGIVLGVGPHRVAGHEFRGAPGESPGPQGRLMVTREVSAVTAACMVVDRSRFLAVGGFDEAGLPVAFNDVDLCLKLGARGWRTIWTPQARLMHLESASRGSDKPTEAAERLGREARLMHERWGGALGADPYYNPNLTLVDESSALASSSRAEALWRRPG